MTSSNRTITVLMGGPGGEYAVSLASGASVAEALRSANCGTIIESVIDRGGLADLDSIEGDVFFPVLHGRWGEGGPLQEILEQDGRPFVGCGAEAAATAMNKHHTKQIARELGIPTPPWEQLAPGQPSKLPPPLVIKPVAEGSSLDLHVARTEAQRDTAVEALSKHETDIIVEQFINGRELTVGIVGDQALPIIEIQAADGLYDYQAKYDREDTIYTVDPVIDPVIKDALLGAAMSLHHGVGARHLSRVDFLLDESGPWLLEINTMPGFTSHSLLPKAAAAHGLPMPNLCRLLVNMAAEEHGSAPARLKQPGPGSR